MSLIFDSLAVFAEENCAQTALFGEVCDACNGGGINYVLMYLIEAMIIGIGILAVIGLMVFGLQFLTAGSNAGRVAKAKGRLIGMIVGIVTYVVLLAGLQFLLPGGIKGIVTTAEDECPEKTETDLTVIEPEDDDDVLGGGGSGGSTTIDDPSGGDSGLSEQINDRLEVHFVSAGHYDDVIIIRSKSGVVLIDGGRERQFNGKRERTKRILKYIEALGIKRINYAIGSHLDENHVGVQGALVDYIPISVAFYPRDISSYDACKPYCEKDAIEELNNMKGKTDIHLARPGIRFDFGDAHMFFIGTRRENFKGDNVNSSSIVNYLKYGNITFLFTGDLGGIGDGNVWSSIKRDAQNYFGISSMKVDVVKWPHHGNSNPTEKFWRETNPKYVAVPNNDDSKFPEYKDRINLSKGAKNASLVRLSSYKYFVFVTDGTNLDMKTDVEPSKWKGNGSFVNGKWTFL